MNRRQKAVLIAGYALLLLVLLFPHYSTGMTGFYLIGTRDGPITIHYTLVGLLAVVAGMVIFSKVLAD